MEEYLGIIKAFAGNFAPRGWALCNGQLLSISQNTALFSLLGTTYGGNGTTTFGLPNLQGRTLVGTGTGAGLNTIVLGEMAGENYHTLTQLEMPTHNHLVNVDTTNATLSTPSSSSYLAVPGSGTGRGFVPTFGYDVSTPTTTLNANTNSMTGGSQPHNNMQPFLGITYIICISGLFPSRN
jgi:microcystin-dependent protein